MLQIALNCATSAFVLLLVFLVCLKSKTFFNISSSRNRRRRRRRNFFLFFSLKVDKNRWILDTNKQINSYNTLSLRVNNDRCARLWGDFLSCRFCLTDKSRNWRQNIKSIECIKFIIWQKKDAFIVLKLVSLLAWRVLSLFVC